MIEQITRRSLIGSMIALVAAPAIVRVESLMKLPAPERFVFPLEPIGDPLFLEPREVTLGYTITRDRMQAALDVIYGLNEPELNSALLPDDRTRILDFSQAQWEKAEDRRLRARGFQLQRLGG